jgi:hypothetical protein
MTAVMTANFSAPDLAAHPPRSPRVRLGGFVILPRILDKGRAEIAGTAGEYHYNCPLDRHWFEFAGIDAGAMKVELARGTGDGEMLAWIAAHSATRRTAWEIASWSSYHDHRCPESSEGREFFAESLDGAEHRDDIATWFDLLDFDDFRTFGGKA